MRWIAFIILVPLLLIAPMSILRVQAQSKVMPSKARKMMVLGLSSLEGDDQLARQLTLSLREAAANLVEWSVSKRKVSLPQMALAHTCEATDVHCLKKIGLSLGTDLLLYGSISRTNEKFNPRVRVELSVFDVKLGTISRSTEDIVAKSHANAQLSQRAERYVQELNGSVFRGTLLVILSSPVPGATVKVGGNVLTAEDGQYFRTEGIGVGEHILDVSVEGFNPVSQSVVVRSNEITEVTINLVPIDTGSSNIDWLPVLGWSGIGIGALSLGLTGFSWLKISSVQNDSDYTGFQNHPANAGAVDVCTNAETSPGNFPDVNLARIKELCGEANTWEVLQYVFLGVGIASIGAGATLLFLHYSRDKDGEIVKEEDSSQESVVFFPVFTRHSAYLGASLKF